MTLELFGTPVWTSFKRLSGVLVSVAFLVIPVGLYFLVLGGVAVLPQGSGVTLTAIAGVATLAAALYRATLPAVTAGVAMVGFGLGVTSSGFIVTVAAALTILGGLGFLLSTLHLIGKQAGDATAI